MAAMQLKRVTLYKNKLAHVTHEGDAGGELQLVVPNAFANLITTSLSVHGPTPVTTRFGAAQDSDAASAAASKNVYGFHVGSGGIGDFLYSIVGSNVRVVMRDGAEDGRVLLVEKEQRAIGDTKNVENVFVAAHLLTAAGHVRRIPLGNITTLQMLDGDLLRELKLKLTQTVDKKRPKVAVPKDKTAITFSSAPAPSAAAGAGSGAGAGAGAGAGGAAAAKACAQVEASFLIPIEPWQALYRLDVSDDSQSATDASEHGKVSVRMLAAVQNTTDEAWENVQLELSANDLSILESLQKELKAIQSGAASGAHRSSSTAPHRQQQQTYLTRYEDLSFSSSGGRGDGGQIFIKTLTGRTVSIDISDFSTSVASLKRMVASKEGIPEDQQRFIYAGKQLENGRRLRDYNISRGATVHLVLRLRGADTWAKQRQSNYNAESDDNFEALTPDIIKGISQAVAYSVPSPCSLAVGESALVEVASHTLAGDRVIVYDSKVSEVSCSRHVHVYNPADGVTLAPGTISVYDNGALQAQNPLPPLLPGEDVLIPCGEDSTIAVTRSSTSSQEIKSVAEYKTYRGRIVGAELTRHSTVTYTYVIKNVSTATDVPRFFIDHHASTQHNGYHLASTATHTTSAAEAGTAPTKLTAIKSSAGFGRFQTSVAVGEEVTVTVVEEAEWQETLSSQSQLASFVRSNAPALVARGVLDAALVDRLRLVSRILELTSRLSTIRSNGTVSDDMTHRRLVAWVAENWADGTMATELAALMAAVEAVRSRKTEVNNLGNTITAMKAQEKTLFTNQERLRSNLQALELHSKSGLVLRYLSDLDQQEDELTGLRQKLQDAEAAKLALQNEISNACLENREACKKICDTVAEL